MSREQEGSQSNNSNDYSQVEKYLFHLENEEPCYYSRIPYILNYLTYIYINKDTGEKEIRKLSVYAKVLYQVIKQFSFENANGRCWASRDHLAEIAGMSSGKISQAKQELSQSFHQLEGNPLIVIVECKKNIPCPTDDTKSLGKTIYHKIGVVNIWKWNNAFIGSKAHIEKTPELDDFFNDDEDEALSPHDGAGGALSPHDTAPVEALSPHDTNNNHPNKNPMFKKQQTPAAAGSVVSENKRRLFVTPEHEKAYLWMISLACEEALAFSIAKKYTPEEISTASDYLIKMKSNPKFSGFKRGKWAYFQNILENKWYLNQG